MSHVVIAFWEATFWLCLAGVGYGYVLYPALVWLFARLFGSEPTPPPEVADARLPTVSLLIAAYNEERSIGERLRNTLSLDYPPSKLEVVIASDGSTDRTNAIVRGCGDPRVRLLAYPDRQGKAGVLNAAFQEVRGDIVVLSDANTFTHPAAVRRLVRWFERPSVGGVCGRLVLTDSNTGTNVDGLYWQYETFLKHCEARLGALLGANGAIYAIRRHLYQDIRPNTLIDDFVIPLLTRLRHGCRVEYDDDAVAYEETPATLESEFRRRARIGTGGFQSLAVLWPLLSPRWGWTAFAFFSHKLNRWICPFLLVGTAISNALLAWFPFGHAVASRRFYAVALGCQICLYLVAWLGMRVKGQALPAKCVRLTTLFAGVNLALLVGFWRWATTEPHGTWTRTTR